jgi:hypothetical protein
MGSHVGDGLLLPLIPLFILAIGLWVSPLSTISAFADEHHDDHHDYHDDHHDYHGGYHDNCTVCHDPHQYHEISIPWDQVDQFLRDHPGDYRGHCQVTPSSCR